MVHNFFLNHEVLILYLSLYESSTEVQNQLWFAKRFCNIEKSLILFFVRYSCQYETNYGNILMYWLFAKLIFWSGFYKDVRTYQDWQITIIRCIYVCIKKLKEIRFDWRTFFWMRITCVTIHSTHAPRNSIS